MKKVALIGYSGHALVVHDIFSNGGKIQVAGYCESQELSNNPLHLLYLGNERDEAVIEQIKAHYFFPCFGDNKLRSRVSEALFGKGVESCNAIDPSAIVSSHARIDTAVMVSMGAHINAFAQIGKGSICNTGSIVEHECIVGPYCHIAPGAVLCGNVQLGAQVYVGANAVIKQGVKIGDGVIIGAGSVILHDIPEGVTVAGNPAKTIEK